MNCKDELMRIMAKEKELWSENKDFRIEMDTNDYDLQN